MDPSSYKTVPTSRGLKYSVYYTLGNNPSKPTVLFLHGFPSSSYDWRHQVAFFEDRGHAIVAPDMLGNGGTDKPTDPALYAGSLVAQDIVDILDGIRVQGRVVVIGHDRGCRVVAGLAQSHTDRFAGFAFLSVGYHVPDPPLTYQQLLALTTKVAGRELFGYWAFFAEDDAPKVVNENFDAFWEILLSSDKEHVKANFAPTGALRAWLLKSKGSSSAFRLPDFISAEELKKQKEIFQKSGLEAPFCWYKASTTSVEMDDAKRAPVANFNVTKPVFYGGALNDPVVPSAIGKAGTQKYCSNTTVKEYESGHWVIWESKDQVNQDLAAWMDSIEG